MAQLKSPYPHSHSAQVWFGHRPWIIVADPELGKRVNYKLNNRPRTLGDPLLQGPITKNENKGLFASRWVMSARQAGG